MAAPFVLYNGNFYPSASPVFPASQTANVLFADELRMVGTKMMFWESHLRLLLIHFNLYKKTLPWFMKNEGSELARQIDRSLVKNKIYRSAVVRLTFFDERVRTGYLIEVEALDENAYTMTEEGIHLASYRDLCKCDSPLASLATGSKALWQMAESAAAPGETPLILSAGNALVEVPRANLYLIRGNRMVTPHAAAGAFVSPARWLIEKLAGQTGFDFSEDEYLTEDDLRNADEAFIADDIRGIQFVRGFESKRYFKKRVQELAGLFNRALVE